MPAAFLAELELLGPELTQTRQQVVERVLLLQVVQDVAELAGLALGAEAADRAFDVLRGGFLEELPQPDLLPPQMLGEQLLPFLAQVFLRRARRRLRHLLEPLLVAVPEALFPMLQVVGKRLLLEPVPGDLEVLAADFLGDLLADDFPRAVAQRLHPVAPSWMPLTPARLTCLSLPPPCEKANPNG